MALIFKDLQGEEKYICRRTLHNLSKTTKTDNINNRFVEVVAICLMPKHLKLLRCPQENYFAARKNCFCGFSLTVFPGINKLVTF